MKTIVTSDNFNYPISPDLFSKTTKDDLLTNAEEQIKVVEQHDSFRRRQIHKQCIEFCYKDNPEDKLWRNDKTELKCLIQLAIDSPEEAKDTLRKWAGLNSYYGGNYGYRILYNLKKEPYLYTMSDQERVCIFQVLIDTIDDMTQDRGNGNRITDPASWVAKPLLQNLPIPVRIEQIRFALQNGKAVSWLIYLVRLFMHLHGELSIPRPPQEVWFIKNELEIIKKATFDRIQVEINANFYKMVDPKQLFLFWQEVGTDLQRKELKEWLVSHTKDDEKFLAFVSIFSGSMYLHNKKIWRVFTGTLENFIDISSVRNRLNRVINDDKRHYERASTLLEGVDLAEELKVKYKFINRVMF